VPTSAATRHVIYTENAFAAGARGCKRIFGAFRVERTCLVAADVALPCWSANVAFRGEKRDLETEGGKRTEWTGENTPYPLPHPTLHRNKFVVTVSHESWAPKCQ